MFIDEAKIRIKAGDGGNGCMAFRREKFVPRGGPSGGDGGHGGDILMSSSLTHNTLVHFRFNPEHKSGRGEHGMGSNCSGQAGAPVTLKVPVGTLLYDDDTNELIHDFARPDQTIVIARGGRGGRGNQHFATSTHQAPVEHELGRPGEERHYRLELRLLADAGLVGYPNVGKSTLISVLSAARPKIANYAFTTLEPNLGVVKVGDWPHEQSFTVADLPGLIEGAHLGAGLGIQFLRHIERTSVIVHLVDVSDFGYAPEPPQTPVILSEVEKPAVPSTTAASPRNTSLLSSPERGPASPPASAAGTSPTIAPLINAVILSAGAAEVEGPAVANASAEGTSPSSDSPEDHGRDPVQAFKTITAELHAFDPALAAKPTILVAAKADVANPEKLKKLRTYSKRRKLPFFEISAVTGQGVDQLKYAIAEAVQTHRVIPLDPEPEPTPKKPKPNYPPPAPNARGRAIS